jgi:hypothetical protein
MEPRLINQDPLHRMSSARLTEVNAVKKECVSTRKKLRNYLRGHLFFFQKNRVERHLRSCSVCASVCQSLRWEEETRQIMKELSPPGRLGHRVKVALSGAGRLKKLLYRPLWLAVLACVAIIVVINVSTQKRDIEIESLEKSLPLATVAALPAASGPTTTAVPSPLPAAGAQAAPSPPVRVQKIPAAEPLAITITPENEQSALRRINEALRGFRALRNQRFTDTERQLSGTLPARELLALFDRIESAGKVNYSRKRFDSFPAAQSIPFVLKLKRAPAPAAQKLSVAPPAVQPSSAQTQTATPPAAERSNP